MSVLHVTTANFLGSFLPGEAGLNLGQGDISAGYAINIFKMATVTFNTPADASKVDSDGYLTSTPAGNVSVTWSSAGSTFVGEDYVLAWPATIGFKLRFNSAMTTVGSPVGATVAGGTGVGTTTITTTSGAGRIVFTVGAANPSAFFMNDGTFSRSAGEIALYRLSDETDYLAGQYWTTEFRARLRELKLSYLRPMGWVNGGGNNFNGEVAWGDRIPTTQFSWNAQRIIPTKWVGEISGDSTYACGSYTDMPGSWTDGEVFLGYISTTNTSTTVTIDVGSRGAKTVKSRAAAAIINTGSGSSRMLAGLATFHYDAVLDAVLYAPSAYQGSIPLEAQIQLANEARSPLWMVFPMWANDDYVTQQATLAKNTLNGMAYYEYTNELWQNTWPQTGWGRARGTALGWSSSGNQDTYGWYGLKVRLIMGDLIPAVYGGTLSARVRRVLAYQGGGFLTIVQDGRFNGSMLTTTIGSAVYDTMSGGRDFNAFPDRPVDVVDSIAFAPYTAGTNLCRGDDIASVVGTPNLPFYQALVDAWVLGDTATCYQLIDDDIRDGRILVQNVTASGTTFTTPANHHLGLSSAFTGSVGSTFTGTQSGTNLTASSVTGVISVGDTISGTGVTAGTTIVSQSSGTTGGAGVYVTSVSGTASAASITAASNVLTVTAVSSGFLECGQVLAGGSFSTTNILSTNLPASGVGTYSFVGTAKTIASASLTSSWSPDIYFDVTGGTAYSGVTTRALYRVLSTPSSTTFTVQPWTGGINTGSAVNAGSAGTGTMTLGRVGINILYQADWMPAFAEAAATTYDAARTGAGMPLLRADWYEGNLEPKGPTTAAEIAAIGITGHTAAAAITAIAEAVEGWRFSDSAKETMKLYYEATTGLHPDFPAHTHTHHTSQLVLSGPGLYSMVSGPLPTDTPYQTYYGFKEFNEENPQS